MTEQSARDWLLKIAQEVESCPGRWTQEEPARNARGFRVKAKAREAVCWCAIGFLSRDDLRGDAYSSVHRALSKTGSHGLSDYNDALKSPADFVAWFRRAAELCT